MLVLKNVEKTYETKARENVQALKNVNLSFSQNEMVFILGQSGSGKTTLLNLLGGIDSQSSGEIYVDDKLLGKDLSLEAYRQNYLGFVFQEYNLIDNLNVFDNIAIALSEGNKKSKAETVSQVLKKVKLEGYEKRRISELSGGQKQRVAIARALAKNAQILLCDEPTGNLDSKTSKEIFALLKELSKDKIVIVVSHNEELSKQFADRTININDGEVTDDDGKIAQARQATNVNKTIKNNVSLALKLKLSLNNLFTHKLKTFVSFILLFLSLLSVSIMQICCSYSPERTIADMFKDSQSIFIVKNTSDREEPDNSEQKNVNISLLSSVGQENYQKLYVLNYCRYFVTDNNNAVINGKEFYFKNTLDDGCAYVTDFFVDYTLQNSEYYEAISFKEYSELNGKEVKYNGNVLYKITGVIKTDYKQFFEKNNITFEKLTTEEYELERITHYSYNMKYYYGVTYVNEKTFNSIESEENSYYFDNDDNIKSVIKLNNEQTTIDDFTLRDSERFSVEFLGADGRVHTNDIDWAYGNLTYTKLGENDIVVDCKLYNELTGKNIDWKKIQQDYDESRYNGTEFNQPIDGLNTKISISLERDGKAICEPQEKTIVGVYFKKADFAFSNYEPEKHAPNGSMMVGYSDYSYELYFSLSTLNLINTDINNVYAVEVNVPSIKNLHGLLTDIEKDGNLVAGRIADSAYDLKYITKNMGYFFIAVMVVFLVISFFSMLNLVNTKIKDNKRQIGILMGIGFTAKDILFIFLLSIIYLLAIALIFIIPLSYIAAHVVNNLLIMEGLGFIKYYMVTIFTYLVLFVASILLVFLSSLPLILFTKKKPIDVIKDNK